jgi:hypothetical protein
MARAHIQPGNRCSPSPQSRIIPDSRRLDILHGEEQAAEWPVRDDDCTTYTGAIETAEQFGPRIYREAWDRGWDRAQTRVVLGDGAPWIWNIADEHFPGAIQIVDLYHAREHLWELAAKIYPADEKRRKGWALGLEKTLDAGKVEAVVKKLRAVSTDSTALAAMIESEAAFFERNAERMRYARFRERKLFLALSRPVAKPLSDADSRCPVCSGLSAAPTPSSPSAATASAASLPIIGSPVPPELYIHVAHPDDACLVTMPVKIV